MQSCIWIKSNLYLRHCAFRLKLPEGIREKLAQMVQILRHKTKNLKEATVCDDLRENTLALKSQP
jgi:hypothetical protein